MPPSASPAKPRIVAVGYRRINRLLREWLPQMADQAHVEVLDVGFDQAVARVKALQASQGVDVVVAAGANGAFLRQHLDTPVVLVKVGGFDVLQALAQARERASMVGLVTYEGMAPDLSRYTDLWQLKVVQRSYRTEEEARQCVQSLRAAGVEVIVGTGTAADHADALGGHGVFLYSTDAVREALDDAVEVARASRIELAKRERLATVLMQLSDGVVAVDERERVETINPTMAQWLGVSPSAWAGRVLSEVCPELSLQHTLRQQTPDLERIDTVRGKHLIVNRMPILEQGRLTGAVLSCQDPIRIQRVDRHLRARLTSGAPGAMHQLSDFLGASEAAQQLREQAQQCARSQATVLLWGETGSGKELIAQGIHQASDRRDMPFVAVNCAAVAESLLESELFGYEEGAFTGARRGGKMGLIEAAHNGSLFLDEVGEMPMALQARLLRVLQTREVLRVGATEPTRVNVRVMAATHRDLKAHVAQGLFRLDLYYRLDILRLAVPPLRQRMGDLDALARALHARICRRLQQTPASSQDLLEALMQQATRYAWPGNVRELENMLERMVVMQPTLPASLTPGQRLARLLPELFGPGDSKAKALPTANASRSQRVHDEAHLMAVLAECEGDRTRAAQRLGISRTTLWRRLQQVNR